MFGLPEIEGAAATMSSDRKIGELLATGQWRFLYSDNAGWLLARTGLALPKTLRETGPSPQRELRLARLASKRGDLAATLRHTRNAKEALPWHRDACLYLATIYRGENKLSAAREVLDDCRSYFPSAQFK